MEDARPVAVLGQANGDGEGGGRAEERWSQKTVDVVEFQTLKLGPFPAGVVCDITFAWYGLPEDTSRQIDTTRYVRSRFASESSLQLSDFNQLFGDPAPLRLKRMTVEYQIRNVSDWDVSRGDYAEGVEKLGLVPSIVAKALTNVVGATFAAGTYALGKTATAIKNLTAKDNEQACVADDAAFQFGFNAWLRLNGIWPTVSYEPFKGGQAEDMKQTPLIIANHVSYLDGLVLAAIFGAPKVIARKGTLNTPLIGGFAKDIGVLEVDRDSPSSRAATLQAIKAHVASWRPGQRPLLLFPEGTTSNGASLLPFKKGAFVCGVSLRPVVFTWTGSWDPATVNYKVGHDGVVEATDDEEWMLHMFGTMLHSLQVKVLAPYRPSAEELADTQLYAENVREVMVAAYAELREKVEDGKKDFWQAAVGGAVSAAVNFIGGAVGCAARASTNGSWWLRPFGFRRGGNV